MKQRIDLARTVPELHRGLVAFERAVDAADIDPRLRELVRIRASQLNGCARCIQLHVTDALRAGEQQSRLDLLVAWREAPCFDDRERAALALTDAVTLLSATGSVDDAVYDEAAARFEPAELASLIYLITAINVRNRLNVTARRPPDALAG
jgi:AhpD family alkylhydroperoxidase